MAAYAILGEDTSDADTLEVIVKRLAGQTTDVKSRGFDGCGEMLSKGAKQIGLFASLGYKRFIVSYDADTDDPNRRRQTVMEKIVWPAGVAKDCCVIIPVQEIEAWILADIEAVTNVIPSWRPSPFKENPEAVNRPKEHLEWLSRSSNKKPRYSHANHNPRVAEHLDLKIVRERCSSFRPLFEWIGKAESELPN
jgi:hypothetical protein